MTGRRDMTEREFRAALRRYGIRQQLVWFTRRDLPKVSIGAIIDPKSMKIRRRATLARVLNYRADD